MLNKSFLIFTVHFVVLSIISFSTGLAHPIPTFTFGSSNDLKLMGRTVTYLNHEVAIMPSFPASIFLRDPDEPSVTRAERFYHQLTQLHQHMQKGMATHTSITSVDE